MKKMSIIALLSITSMSLMANESFKVYKKKTKKVLQTKNAKKARPDVYCHTTTAFTFKCPKNSINPEGTIFYSSTVWTFCATGVVVSGTSAVDDKQCNTCPPETTVTADLN